jgi:DNA primase large subunit
VFTRTPGDKFNKEYAYNVRYNYGQEGKRQDWSEWNCVKIISQVGGFDDHVIVTSATHGRTCRRALQDRSHQPWLQCRCMLLGLVL